MIIVVEGNIGAGKSVLCKLLCSELSVCSKNVEYVEEPLDLWTDMNGQNILKLFYQNKDRWAFTFQVNAMHTMFNNSLKAIRLSEEGKLVIMERSVFSSTEIFAKVLSENIFSPAEIVTFNNCKSVIPNTFQTYTNKILIYVKTKPDVCLKRIEQRSRKEEIDNLSIDYLKQLDKAHEENIYTQKDYKQIFEIEGTSYSINRIDTQKDGFKSLVKNVLVMLE